MANKITSVKAAWIAAIAAIVVAIIGAFPSLIKPQKKSESTEPNISISDVKEPSIITGDNNKIENNQKVEHVNAGRDMTIIMSQNKENDPLGKPLETEDKFIGALDGEYENKSNGFILANASFNTEEITFIAGNCLFINKLKQEAGSWDLYLVGTDGVCSFLQEIKLGEKTMRIIPVPGTMTNSGRVSEFVAQSGKYVLNDFFGTYELK